MDISEKHTDKLLNVNKPNYGRGMRKLRGILDLSQKEMAGKLNMLPQQLSLLEQKEKWTEEQLKRVSETFNIPVSGLDYLANENDLLNFIFTNNTQGDDGIIGLNNSRNTYHFENTDKIDKLFSNLETIVKEWNQIKNSMNQD